MTLPIRAGDTLARVNWGRWIADCAPPCRNAWALDPMQQQWTCNLCGAESSVTWPPDPAAIGYLLMMRPDEITRNWEPGESLMDLLADNVAHGIHPPETAGLDTTVKRSIDLLVTEDDRAVDGWMLPAILRQRQAIGDGRYRHMIEVN